DAEAWNQPPAGRQAWRTAQLILLTGTRQCRISVTNSRCTSLRCAMRLTSTIMRQQNHLSRDLLSGSRLLPAGPVLALLICVGTRAYCTARLLEPLDHPADGEVLVCRSRPARGVVIDL